MNLIEIYNSKNYQDKIKKKENPWIFNFIKTVYEVLDHVTTQGFSITPNEVTVLSDRLERAIIPQAENLEGFRPGQLTHDRNSFMPDIDIDLRLR
jgi:hypothetical protein